MATEFNVSQNHAPAPQKVTRFKKSIVDTWIYEVVAMIFSLMCFTGIIAALIACDNKPAPGFSYGLTLNAIISLLAGASKSSLVFVIAECIGQLKWLWFYDSGEKRKLDDMQLFDGASRGPMGSLSVIWRHRGRSLVSLGALITVLAFAFDPFMQQIISYPIRNTVVATESSDAVVKQATSLLLESFSDVRLESIVYPGQWGVNMDITATCPSGNCTWPEFQSVEICHQCDDATAAFWLECPQFLFNTSDDRPDNQEFYCEIIDSLAGEWIGRLDISTWENSTDPDVWVGINMRKDMLWTRYNSEFGFSDWSEMTFAGLRSPQYVVIHVQMALADDANLTGLSPFDDLGSILRIDKVDQCAWALCSRINTVSVINGATSVTKSPPDYGEPFYVNASTGEVLHGISPTDLGFEELERMAEWVRPCWKAGTDGPPASLTQLSGSGIWVNTSEFAVFDIDDYWRLARFTNGAGYWVFTMDNITSAWVKDGEYHDAMAAKPLFAGLETSMSNIANALSTAALLASNQSVYGTVYRGETYVSVNWVWILLPTTLVALGVCFLLLTILANRREQLDLWKSSILAVLFHGLDEVKSGGLMTRYHTVRQMEQTAEHIHVRLKRSSQQRGLVLDQS